VLTRDRATAAPSINDLRAQVQRIQSEVAAIDEQVGAAAEAYNGAVYQLGLINTRIESNRAGIIRATNKLHAVQDELAARLRAEYVSPQPTPMQLLLTTRSASAVANGTEAMERAALRDSAVIRTVRSLRAERVKRAAELKRDQTQAKVEVANKAAKRDAVQALLARRSAVLASAKGALKRELDAEARREAARRAEADRQAKLMMRRQNTGGSTTTPAPSGGGGTTAPPVSSGGSARNAQAARIAMQYLGVPYVWGGSTPSGFDCSGLVMYAYAKVGVSMPHYTGAQYAAFPKVSYSDLQPGDLVFFYGLEHVGMYIGGGMMVHAPHTGDVVRVAPIAGRSFAGAVRP